MDRINKAAQKILEQAIKLQELKQAGLLPEGKEGVSFPIDLPEMKGEFVYEKDKWVWHDKK